MKFLEGGLAPQATVMSWRGIEGGIEAAKQNHDVIMTPTSHCYFDYYQGNPDNEPVAIGGYLPLSKVYSYEPVPEELDSTEEAKYILGTQANVWTEYLPNLRMSNICLCQDWLLFRKFAGPIRNLKIWMIFYPDFLNS